MTVTAAATITSTQVWALMTTACAFATVVSAGARLLVPTRASRLPAPAPIGAITITAALIWLALQHRFPDDPGLPETALYAITFIAATTATIMLAITDEASSSIRSRSRRHTIGYLLLSMAIIGLLLALTNAIE